MDKILNIPEAPNINTPIENSNTIEHTIDTEKKLIIKFNDKSVSFSVIQSSSLLQKDYEVNLTLEQLYKINKFFINFENINDLVDWIINSLKQKNSNIKFNNNKCFIEMLNPISNKSFQLILNSKEKDLNSRVNNLEQIIIEQNKTITLMEERLKKLESIIIEYNELKKKNEEKKVKLFIESEIINNEEESLLLSWLPKKPNKVTLLLNSNKDGDSTKTFINKCNGKCPTLAIIKTTNGYKFGGYTTQIWKEGEIQDNNAFVFSFDKKKKYNIKQPEHAIGFRLNSFWLFGYSNNAIVIYENCTKINNNYVDNNTYDIQDSYELNGGERNFIVKSFEIFLIEY